MNRGKTKPKGTAKPCCKSLRSHWLKMLATDIESVEQGMAALAFLLSVTPAERERQGYHDALALVGHTMFGDVWTASNRLRHARASIKGVAK
jgi:hypothetical protein